MPAEGVAALAAAAATALAEIRGDADPRSAYEQATALGILARALLDDAAAARGCALARIQAADGATLTAVAAGVGMSKQSAAGLMKRAERGKASLTFG